ncbi:MAG: phosphate ABC transporter permease subunit PstC [Brevinematia bacterium]
MKDKLKNMISDSAWFEKVLSIFGYFILFLISMIFISLLLFSIPSIKKFGLAFFTKTTWDPVSGEFGALPFIIGTILTSILALLLSIPFSFSVSIFLTEYFPSGWLSNLLSSSLELLAGIPSIIYGMWGLFILSPLVRTLQTKIGTTPYGVGIFTASIILTLMIIPYAASTSKEVIGMVPNELKEAAYSLGATKYEVIKKVIVPYSSSGIIAGFLLSLGRALGETMAVTMVIGNSYFLPKNIFSPAHTIASIIANEFTEATDTIYVSSLIELGLILFLITFLFSFIGRIIVKRVSIKGG